MKILLIEDEEDIADLIKLQAELSGYKVVIENDGLNGLLALDREKPDLVILDVMLPGLNGLEVCRKIKANPSTRETPVIMISAKTEEVDIILGLELGADDYVSKPFSLKILFSRIRAVLRRGKDKDKQQKHLYFGLCRLELQSYQLFKKDKLISLTLSEFNILKALLLCKGKVLTRSQLLDEVTDDETFIVDRNVDVHIAALRKKLGPNFQGIETVRGVGYRFSEED